MIIFKYFPTDVWFFWLMTLKRDMTIDIFERINYTFHIILFFIIFAWIELFFCLKKEQCIYNLENSKDIFWFLIITFCICILRWELFFQKGPRLLTLNRDVNIRYPNCSRLLSNHYDKIVTKELSIILYESLYYIGGSELWFSSQLIGT